MLNQNNQFRCPTGLHKILDGTLSANAFLFVLPGILISLRSKSFFYNFQLFLYTSLAIEFLQLFLKRGIFDITDIILNVAGGFIGIYIGGFLKGKFYIVNKRDESL